LVRRVLDNLLRNAVRHLEPGGTVRLTAACEGNTLRIEVRDDGPGVAGELRATLFEPFVTGRADGTGLGLAIARECAEAHGGTLRLLDSDLPGAAFRLDLPLAAP
jgi:signal transduction histidine kinase